MCALIQATPYDRTQGATEISPSLTECRLANYCKEPRLEVGFSAIARFVSEDFQIHGLQDVFRFCMVALATTESPAKTGNMKPFELSLQLTKFHAFLFPLISRHSDMII